MRIEQHYEKCLSQASYYIEHAGVAVIIDPLRDTEIYRQLAGQSGAEIRYVFETHFHADFVSGHLELMDSTDAVIVFGPGAETPFPSYSAADGEIFDLGGPTLEVLHTPGHTLESCCFYLKDEKGNPIALFTGDTLFLGDVGRPDLAQQIHGDLKQQDLAGMLYDSLRTKIMPLPDHILIYPGHGAGSACGKNMSTERSGLLGEQRHLNYALDTSLSKTDFISALCDGLQAPPPYFPMNVKLNSGGYTLMDKLKESGFIGFDAVHFKQELAKSGTCVLDTRDANQFAERHIPGSINIGLDGSFAPWVGAIIPTEQASVLLVCNPDREMEAMTRLARIGFHNCRGFLNGGISSWTDQGFVVDRVKSISAAEFMQHPLKLQGKMIDVRTDAEFSNDHIPSSLHIPLAQNLEIEKIGRTNEEYLVYCAGGYRSMIFISMLKAKGFHSLTNVVGGMAAIRSMAEAKKI